jgi:hypothetical protein
MEATRQRIEDLECVVEDDYNFLNRKVRKLFGMVGKMKGKWCNSCEVPLDRVFLLRFFCMIRRGRRIILAWGRAN